MRASYALPVIIVMLLVVALIGVIIKSFSDAFFPSVKFQGDSQLENLKSMFAGKILVEPLKTKINRHKIFWVGRSEMDNALRVGVEFSGGRRYFFDWDDFRQDARCSGYKIMTDAEADQLEAEIQQKRKESKS